ncbi:N-formylglutamate amidohydrolase [Arenibaculum pallidiluteum]|uniref:N-formylglutamate amidohydrolase n=1 Tax=Arenibaculum pallidiluteum TaxID=2812559 RepID=UPI001A97A7ED|nr:N-formylglutamate amidohydrolase [Arenibaculum pallidiluteum]
MIPSHTLIRPSADALPLLLDSPHSGTGYPDDFRPAAPMSVLRRGEDMYVDDLYAEAPRHGATLLLAGFPRVYLDANRPADDIDPELLADPYPEPINPGPKTRIGKGLVWRMAAPGVPIYDRLLPAAEVKARIDRYWRPYHGALRAELDALHARWGAVWHIDCHSMPAVSDDLSEEGPGQPRADFVLGDRDGTTCEPGFTQAVAAALRGLGYDVRLNDPYKGVELVRAYGDPAAGRHSLQVEINRRLYMDEASFARAPGYGQLKTDLGRMVAAVADYVRGRVAR